MRSGDLEPAVSDRLTYLFKKIQLELSVLNEELLTPLGITAGELALLALIDARAPESQQQLAGRLGIDRTTMVGTIDSLEARELVARRPDPADRRRNVLELSAAGRRMLRTAMPASVAAERRLLAPLEEAEATQLRGLLARIAAPPPR